jgi:hypothetical protein
MTDTVTFQITDLSSWDALYGGRRHADDFSVFEKDTKTARRETSTKLISPFETHCLLEYGALNIKFMNIPPQIR